MKKMKKIFAMVLSLIMVLGLGLTSQAATQANITIEGAGTAAKFASAFVMKEDATTKTGWTFTNATYEGIFKTAFGMTDAQATIEAYIQDTDTAKKATALAGVKATLNEADAVVGNTITVTEAGLYVIAGWEEGFAYSPMASFVGINYEDGKANGVVESTSVVAKRATTDISKENNDDDKVVEIGRDVTYTVESIIPYIPTTDTNKYYVFEDTILGAVYKTVDGKLPVSVSVGDEGAVVYEAIVTDNSFTLDLTSLITDTNDNANKTITLTYVATVTDVKVNNTIKAGDGTTEGKDKYGSDNDKLITGKVTLTKVNEDSKPLSGAEFVVLKTTDEGTTVYATFDADNKLSGWVENIDEATRVVTGKDGTVVVSGLDKAIAYEFKEVKAPTGYSINQTNVTVTWGDASASLDNEVEGTTSMVDTKLSELPGTGGIGTTIFTLGGCIIMIAAAALFFLKRKKSEE